MRFHVALPNSGSPDDLVDLTVRAESLGYAGVWLADHVLPARRHPDPSYASEYDPLILLGMLSAHTSLIRLGTSILVLPLRNPYVVAKQAASLDALSGGRLNLGIGVGWDAEEFAAIGASFGDRGLRTNEAVALMRHLWSGSREDFIGKYYNYLGGDFTPVRPSSIPITVGGFSRQAIQRAINIGDGWQSVYLDGLGTDPAQFASANREIKDATDGKTRTMIKRYARNREQLHSLIAELDDWAGAGADDIVIWFGEPAGFSALQEEFAHKVKVMQHE